MLGPTDPGWSLAPVVGHADISLHDPPELTRLVVGELPGSFEELCLSHWDAAIILRREVLCEKPRGVCQLIVRDGVVRERQGDDNLVFQNFHLKSAPRVGHRFLSFTTGASALVNSTPAYLRVRRIAPSVAGAPAYAPVSILLTTRWTPERSARSRTVQSSNPRAALICALVTSTSPGRPDSLGGRGFKSHRPLQLSRGLPRPCPLGEAGGKRKGVFSRLGSRPTLGWLNRRHGPILTTILLIVPSPADLLVA